MVMTYGSSTERIQTAACLRGVSQRKLSGLRREAFAIHGCCQLVFIAVFGFTMVMVVLVRVFRFCCRYCITALSGWLELLLFGFWLGSLVFGDLGAVEKSVNLLPLLE